MRIRKGLTKDFLCPRHNFQDASYNNQMMIRYLWEFDAAMLLLQIYTKHVCIVRTEIALMFEVRYNLFIKPVFV